MVVVVVVGCLIQQLGLCLLRRNDAFELLLQKNTLLKEDERIELRLALHRYLQKTHPLDIKKLQMMFLSFNMWREWAEALKARAEKLLTVPNTNLQTIMNLYLDASDYFLKDRCFQLSIKCLSMVRTLQVLEPHGSARDG